MMCFLNTVTQTLTKSQTDQPKKKLTKKKMKKNVELAQLQKICYRLVAPLQKTNNVKLTQINVLFVCLFVFVSVCVVCVCVTDNLFSVHKTVIYKSWDNKKKLVEISTKIFFLLLLYELAFLFNKNYISNNIVIRI